MLGDDGNNASKKARGGSQQGENQTGKFGYVPEK